MKKLNKTGLSAFLALGLAMNFESMGTINPEELEPAPKKKPVIKPIPKGCKRYYFNQWGAFRHTQRDDTVFTTDASNRKNAERKFNKWKAKNL